MSQGSSAGSSTAGLSASHTMEEDDPDEVADAIQSTIRANYIESLISKGVLRRSGLGSG